MKKLAYLILIAAIAVSGYFAYDTYVKVMNDDDGNDSEAKEEGKSNINVKYNEYSLDSKYKYSLAEETDKKTTVYFYANKVGCDTADVFKSSNKELGLVLVVDKDSVGVSATKVSTSSLYIRQTNGKYLEITGAPNTKNSIQLTKNGTKLTGVADLTWTNRSIKGQIESTICAANV